MRSSARGLASLDQNKKRFQSNFLAFFSGFGGDGDGGLSDNSDRVYGFGNVSSISSACDDYCRLTTTKGARAGLELRLQGAFRARLEYRLQGVLERGSNTVSKGP